MKIFGGILIAALGIWLLFKTESVMNTFGRIEWAEVKMQMYGGSRMAYKLIGLIAVIVGMLMITGLGGPILESVAHSMFGQR